MPTAIRRCQVRPGGAHCDGEMARREEEDEDAEEEEAEKTPLIRPTTTLT